MNSLIQFNTSSLTRQEHDMAITTIGSIIMLKYSGY